MLKNSGPSFEMVRLRRLLKNSLLFLLLGGAPPNLLGPRAHRLCRRTPSRRATSACHTPSRSSRAASIRRRSSPEKFRRITRRPFMDSLFHSCPEVVSYLLIKSPKSLTNKDFTSKSLFLKDLEETNR
jgi:hypothetical protein